jgi:hypothetical protein
MVKPMMQENDLIEASECETPEIEVSRYVGLFENVWNELPAWFPPFDISYTIKEKKICEKEIKKFFDSLYKENRIEGNDCSGREKLRLKYTDAIRSFMSRRLKFNDADLTLLFENGFMEASSGFIDMARAFDPEVSDGEILQAIRNVWAMNWVQLLLKLPVKLTPSIFAYSMLYPYTDNFLDDPEMTKEEKMEFNSRLSLRLSGKIIGASTPNETIVYRLIEMIEEKYDRTLFPKVFESLIAIHNAQIKSLSLASGTLKVSDSCILKISIEKGGTSVLADGYLAAGNLTGEEEEFLFGYGAFLQLVDDQQDITDDYKKGFATLFTNARSGMERDFLSNRTYSLGDYVLNLLPNTSDTEIISRIMQRMNQLMIIDSVARASNFYSESFIKQIQQFSPFNYSFYENSKNSFLQSNSLFAS